MNASILYNLFDTLRKEERLVAGGISEFLLLEQQLSSTFNMTDYDDFVFACELVLVKNKSEQEVFRSIMNNWRADIEKYIAAQYAKIEKFKPATTLPEPGKIKPGTTPGESGLPPIPGARDNRPQPVVNVPPAGTVTDTPSPGTETVEHIEETGESEITISLVDETAGQQGEGKAFKPTADVPVEGPEKKFLLGNEYFPVANRSLRQNWRTLKNRQDINEYGTIDLMATIDEITRTGLFLGFQYQKKTTNLLSLFIFIDRGASMKATEAFGKELAESALQSGIHLEIKPWYFHDVPDMVGEADSPDYMLLNDDETDARTISQLFRNINKKNIVALVYGDAGAFSLANTELLRLREEKTIEFIRYLLRHTAYTAWLNPAPRHRWQGTIADKISKTYSETGMFEASSIGFEQAVNALRGKITIK